MAQPHILFIPGLGDRVWLYQLAAPLWQVFGYATHVHRFGWNDGSRSLGEKQAELIRYVDDLPADRLYVIGMSAGGTAAVNLLMQRPTIRKVITIASPLRTKDSPTNGFLMGSIGQVEATLPTASEKLRKKIVSVHGSYDSRVPVPKSQPRGIQTMRLPTVGHGLTIALALTVYGGAIRRLLR